MAQMRAPQVSANGAVFYVSTGPLLFVDLSAIPHLTAWQFRYLFSPVPALLIVSPRQRAPRGSSPIPLRWAHHHFFPFLRMD